MSLLLGVSLGMYTTILNGISALGLAELENALTSAGERAIKKYNSNREWEKLFVETGVFSTK